ncbi:G protein-coupled receptor kinase 1-like [Argiope bruennichi]|uniref:G protein-coupled receptor kinase 1 like protein n=1 Tax=Argiope bruennichi TaxID=94029 RepID=A0A8T0F9C9_ARGBR|nr:G protein-coupled receptor kinase 1-like [Argiope bruennichi]XP_055942373.1 G protein-coupled receptor kinase 1-like [Argiope bruennichi]KAF8787491.1 G protein-coupled receptor kinase 1 like protein [Argiope bruennichi]
MASNIRKQQKEEREMPPSKFPRTKEYRENKLTDADQESYKNFSAVKRKFDDEEEFGCIIHGYLKKLGGPFPSSWQTRYAQLYFNRLELHAESSSVRPELIFIDQIEEVVADYVMVNGKQCIVLKMNAEKCRDAEIVLTNPDEIALKEWLTSLESTYKNALELLATMAKKADDIFTALNIQY